MKGKRAERPESAATEKAKVKVEWVAPVAPAEATPAEGATPADTTLKTYEKIIVTESLKHSFTTHELAEIADQMGAAASHVFRIESEKAEQAAHYGALLKAANRTHAELVAKYNLRYEMRDVECRVEYDKPEPGYKSVVRVDNGESVREVRMSEAEKQRAFVFDPGDGKPQ